jgi:hypothetical protein
LNPPRALGIALIVATNAVPVIGMVFLGWRADRLVLLYFLDTMVSVVAVLTLGAIYSKEMWGGERRTLKNALGMVFAIPILAGVLALPLSLPVFAMAGFSMDALQALDDHAFRIGLLAQLFMAAMDFIRTAWEVRKGADCDATLKSRLAVVLLRWVAVFAVGLTVSWAPLLIIAYVAASVYFEIRPPPPE